MFVAIGFCFNVITNKNYIFNVQLIDHRIDSWDLFAIVKCFDPAAGDIFKFFVVI